MRFKIGKLHNLYLFVLITYILFHTKMQKGKPSEISLPLLKNDITGSEPTVKILDA